MWLHTHTFLGQLLCWRAKRHTFSHFCLLEYLKKEKREERERERERERGGRERGKSERERKLILDANLTRVPNNKTCTCPRTHIHAFAYTLICTSWLIADIYNCSGKFTDRCTYGCRDERRIDPWPWKRCGAQGRKAARGGWWCGEGGSPRAWGGKESRRATSGRGIWWSWRLLCAVATSLDVEASRVSTRWGLVSLFSLDPLSHFLSSSSASCPSFSIPCRLSRAFPPLALFLSSLFSHTIGSVPLALISSFALCLSPLVVSPLLPPFVIPPPSLVLPLPLYSSLTLSLRSSAKTSIRLSSVAPRYTSPTEHHVRRSACLGVTWTLRLSRLAITISITRDERHASRATCAWHLARHDVILDDLDPTIFLASVENSVRFLANKFYIFFRNWILRKIQDTQLPNCVEISGLLRTEILYSTKHKFSGPSIVICLTVLSSEHSNRDLFDQR